MKNYLLVLVLGLSIYLVLTPKDLFFGTGVKSTSSYSETESLDSVAAGQTQLPLHPKGNDLADAKSSVVTLSERNLPSPSLNVTEKRLQNFQSLLHKIGPCLELKNSLSLSSNEPKIDNLLSSLQGDLGDPVIRSEDWTSTEIETPSQEKKLIKIETNYENEDIVKKLKYFNVTNEGLIPIDLSDEQTTEPTSTFLASLESEGKVIKTEKSERVFYQNGEEVLYTESNGLIEFIEISRQGKTLKCPSLEKSDCTCR